MNNELIRAQHMINLPNKENGIWYVEYLDRFRWVKQEFDSCENAWAYYYTKLKELKEQVIKRKER